MSEPELKIIEVSDGAELTLRLWRSSSAVDIPVLLLHGLSQQGQFWAPVVNRLSAGSVAALDQRGHGRSDVPLDLEFTIPRCALDVAEVCAALGWNQVIVVGHSWGAWVAINAAAEFPDLIRAIALIDGGLWGPADLAESIGREATLEQLRPPQLAMTSNELWQMLESGPMANWWSDETRAALEPTFSQGADGLFGSTLGLERHLRVLAGLLDYSVDFDLRTIDCPIWTVLCESGGMEPPEGALARAAATPSIRLQRWQGAVHDVPLQWPSMVAGLIDTVAETEQLAFQKGVSR
jgi:pimeloyl-ACP methyl ester carboxylesterase